MNAQDWRDMASVFQAGADVHRAYAYNTDRQGMADALAAQAARCTRVAFERDPVGTKFLMQTRYVKVPSGLGNHHLCLAYPPWMQNLLQDALVKQAWGMGSTVPEALAQAATMLETIRAKAS